MRSYLLKGWRLQYRNVNRLAKVTLETNRVILLLMTSKTFPCDMRPGVPLIIDKTAPKLQLCWGMIAIPFFNNRGIMKWSEAVFYSVTMLTLLTMFILFFLNLQGYRF